MSDEEYLQIEQTFTWSYQIAPFGFEIKRKETNERIFSNEGFNFIFSDYYLEFTTIVPTPFIFGIGERNYPDFQMRPGTYTLFNKDMVGIVDDGKLPGDNIYGSQPVYLAKEKSGKYHIVLFQSSLPMDIIIGQSQENPTITYKTIGGIFNFKIFLGNEYPETAIKLYHEYLKGFTIPPFWSLGFHQSRWGYHSLNVLKDVYQSYQRAQIPIDVMWNDLDYMDDKQIFTIDQFNYNPNLLNDFLNSYNVKYVPLVDPGIGCKKRNEPVMRAYEMSVLLRDPSSGKPLVGAVWPGPTVFVDWSHPNSSKYWSEQIVEFHKKVNFNGLWLDMNELANFCDGQCSEKIDQFIDNLRRQNGQDNIQLQDQSYITIAPEFPYIPGEAYLNQKTIPINTKHFDGTLEYEVHNVFCIAEMKLTYEAMKNQLKMPLPFILTRANFPGAGRYSAHWTGDNLANFDFLKMSIPALFNFNLFGQPQVGADVCGFFGDTQNKLCARWIQLATIYTFSRNHNHDQAIDQEFYKLGSDVQSAAKASISQRYSMLKHMYSLFLKSGQKGTILKPLFFEFINDKRTFEFNIMNYQIMLGKELMAAPILNSTLNSAGIYFPQGAWFELSTWKKVQAETDLPKKRVVYTPLSGGLPMYLREGYLFGEQDVSKVLKTDDLSKKFIITASIFRGDDQNDPLQLQNWMYDKKDAREQKKGMFELKKENERIIAIYGVSKGQMISIENLNEYEVSKYCIGDQECIVNVDIYLYKNNIKYPNTYIVNMTFTPTEKTNELQQVEITDLKLFNIPLKWQNLLLETKNVNCLKGKRTNNQGFEYTQDQIQHLRTRYLYNWFFHINEFDIKSYQSLVILVKGAVYLNMLIILLVLVLIVLF